MNESQGPLGNRDLLRPSLTTPSASATAIYSTTTGYVSAFFGGPIGAAIIVLLNSRRLDRLQRDWPFGILAVLATVAGIYWQLNGGPRIVGFVVSIGVFGLGYLLHRKHYRAMELIGVTPPSGWVPGIAAVAIGLVVTIAIAFVAHLVLR